MTETDEQVGVGQPVARPASEDQIFSTWWGRGLSGSAVLGAGAYLMFLDTDHRYTVLAWSIMLGGAVLAWEVALSILAVGLLVWGAISAWDGLSDMKTSTAVLIGAVIIAAAVYETRRGS